MRGRGMLWLVAGVVAGGCTRDAPTVAPTAGDAAVESQAALVATDDAPAADAIDDALDRLLPALGGDGAALRGPLLRLRARRGDPAAREDVQRLLDRLDATLPEARAPDLDALRLALGAATP